MQTFLPFADFAESARCLDMKRLGKQRVEVLQLLTATSSADAGWANHPASMMWSHHRGALALYGLAVCGEWLSRGYKDTCVGKILAFMPDDFVDHLEDVAMPPWLGDERLHWSHRAALMRKDPYFYGEKMSVVTDKMPFDRDRWGQYFWPSLCKAYGGDGDGWLAQK